MHYYRLSTQARAEYIDCLTQAAQKPNVRVGLAAFNQLAKNTRYHGDIHVSPIREKIPPATIARINGSLSFLFGKGRRNRG